jgi:hypothetical protein
MLAKTILGTLVTLVLGTAAVSAQDAQPAPKDAPNSADAQRRIETARVLEPILANPPCSGLLVFEVEPGSQAERAGLKPGDILTTYDGQPVASIGELSELARQVFQGKPTSIVVIVKRGSEEIVSEFEPAPMGLRMTAVQAGRSVKLWRAPTPYQPNSEGLTNALKSPHRWERLTRDNMTVGWAHHYYTRKGPELVQRTQSRLFGDGFDERADVSVQFATNPYLSLRSAQISSNDRSILSVKFNHAMAEGERMGIPVHAPVAKDAVSFHLAGMVASMMPREAGACLRCSYLDAGSLSAAPYADLYCVGPETLKVELDAVETVHYEQTVFGEKVADFWIDGNRSIVKTRFADGLEATRADYAELQKQFPDIDKSFPPIEQIPEVGPAIPQAN